MTNPDLDDPGALTLLAAVGWRLLPDPAAARELCTRLPADEIDKAARCLKLRKILRTLASRKLGVEAATDQFFEFQEGVATTVQRLSDRVKGGGLRVEFADEFWREITDVVARLNGREIEALPAQVKTELADGFGIAGLFYWLLDIATLLSGGPLNILEKEIDAAIDAAISEVCAGVEEGTPAATIRRRRGGAQFPSPNSTGRRLCGVSCIAGSASTRTW